MKLKALLVFVECLSFLLWIVFTILSISLTGLGIEGILFALFMLAASSTEPVHFPFGMVGFGGMGVFFSILWRQIGVDHLHYLQYDSLKFIDGAKDAPSSVLNELIYEVEHSTGYARNDARTKAKSWLIDHVTSLDEEDIQLAKAHFGYMLPAGWGVPPKELLRTR